MGIFKSKNEKRLDEIILRMEMNMSNNYKDNAQSNFKELEEQLENLKADGSLKKKVLEKYEKTLETYRIKLDGYSHKDQKPYWT